jgi:hypothetical protein
MQLMNAVRWAGSPPKVKDPSAFERIVMSPKASHRKDAVAWTASRSP